MLKYTQEQVERIFASRGFVLKDRYHGSNISCMAVCSCGQLTDITLTRVLQGGSCKQCGIQKRAQTRMHSQEFIEQQFKAQGCELLDMYKGADIPVKYRCSCGRVSFIRYSNFSKGNRCKQCGFKKISIGQIGNKNPVWNPDREQVEQNNKIAKQLWTLLWSCLYRVGGQKEGHTFEQLGYTAQELDSHLRSFPRFAYLEVTKTLAIDHIFPVKAFVDHGIFDSKIICALANLQPLSRQENMQKGDLYNEDQFLQYCQEHDLVVQQRKVA